MIIKRSIDTPIREGLTVAETWNQADDGLIGCWERGRQKALSDPLLAERAAKGELVPLAWKGGIEKAIKTKKVGPLFYYATWLGLRGDDLNIDTEDKLTLTCIRYGVTVIFSGKPEDYGNA